METIKWENANALKLECLWRWQKTAMYFASKMERYRLLKSGFSASVERRTLCIIKMTFIRSSGQKRN